MSAIRIAFSIVLCTMAHAALASAAPLDTPFKNLAEISQATSFDQYTQNKAVKKVKIAILDNGFKGYASQLGKTIPATAIYHAGPIPVDAKSEELHGLFMTQLVSELLSTPNSVSGFKVPFEIHMYSAFGYTNLQSAIESVIANKFDVVLYSQVWEYGGNGDSHGFINQLVSRATAAGILWINAAGNFAEATYRGPVLAAQDQWVKLPSANDSVRVRCEANSQGQCPLRVVLTWNDFKDDVNVGTDKDLDLYLTDDTLNIITNSAFQQVKVIPNPAPPGASLFPREFIETMVNRGTYNIRVKIRSNNFDSKHDSLRITVSGEHVTLLDKTAGETLLPPADNPSVITVGATDFVGSAFSKRLQKPEFASVSVLDLKNGAQYAGTSNSAAIAAAAVAALKASRPELSRTDALQHLRTAAPINDGGQVLTPPPIISSEGDGLELSVLKFAPTGQHCFEPTSLAFVPLPLIGVLQQGAITVESSAGPKVFTEQDPFANFGLNRIASDDMLVVSTAGIFPQPRRFEGNLPDGSYEIVQIPKGQAICKSAAVLPSRRNGRTMTTGLQP